MGRGREQDGSGKQKKQKKTAEQMDRETKARAAREAAKSIKRMRRRDIMLQAQASRRNAKLKRIKARADRLGIKLNPECPIRSYRNALRKLKANK